MKSGRWNGGKGHGKLDEMLRGDGRKMEEMEEGGVGCSLD